MPNPVLGIQANEVNKTGKSLPFGMKNSNNKQMIVVFILFKSLFFNISDDARSLCYISISVWFVSLHYGCKMKWREVIKISTNFIIGID